MRSHLTVALSLLTASLGCGDALRSIAPSISVSPSSLAFGDAAVGVEQTLRVEVSNPGLATLTVSGIHVAQDPNAELSVTDLLAADCSGAGRSGGLQLQPGECAQFTVRWKPTAVHAAAGAIEVDSNDADHGAVILPVAGSGVSPALQICVLTAAGAVDPTACSTRASVLQNVPAVDFGAGTVGQATSRVVRLTNQGKVALALSPAAHLTTGTPADFSLAGAAASSIAAGASADLTVAVTPAGNGSISGSLEVDTNDPLAAAVQVPLLVTVTGSALCVSSGGALDFGPVPVGQVLSKTVKLSNCGNVDFQLVKFSFSPITPTIGQFTFPAAALPVIPSTLKVGASITLPVTYAPLAARNDSAYFSYRVQLPDGTDSEGIISLTGSGLTTSGCSANGPVANIAVYRNGSATPIDPVRTTLQPLDVVTLDGSGSTHSAGTPGYQWQLVSEPFGAVDVLTGTGAQVELVTRQAGDYVVELVVQDAQGCQSAATMVTLHVVPVGAIHVELTWQEGYGDVDLHYIGPGGSFYEQEPDQGDLDWEYSLAHAVGPGRPTPTHNQPPDWGWHDTVSSDGDPSNDPSLDVDQRWGNGPENVTHPKPFDGTYQVVVHYYCASAGENAHNPSQGNATATVTVWINGVKWPATSPTASLAPYQVWSAAAIVVSDSGSNITVQYSTSAPHDDTTGAPNCKSR